MAQDLPRSTRALLDFVQRPPRRSGATLDVASHGATIALVAGGPYVHVDFRACELARSAGVAQVLHADTLPRGPFDTVSFDAREYDPGLAAEIVANAAEVLAPDGRLLTTARKADVEMAFLEVSEQGEVLLARSPRPHQPRPKWPNCPVPWADQVYQIQSAPGVFSPGGIDEGTRFMLSLIQSRNGDRFLDLGCGTGVVSLVASEAWHCRVTAVDVNARALRLTALNAPRAEVVPSDGFKHLGQQEFDIVASNPPYHSDFGVARAFIEDAFQCLMPGGMLYLVVKRADWYIQKARTVFGGCRVAQEGGYTVIIAEKRIGPTASRPPATQRTTRKHARRTAMSAKKPR